MTVTISMTSVINHVRGPGQGLGPGQADQDPDLEADIITIKADQGPDHQLSKGTKVCTLSIETFIQIFLNK